MSNDIVRHKIEFIVTEKSEIQNVTEASRRPEFNNDILKIKNERLRYGLPNSPFRFHIVAKYPLPLKTFFDYPKKAKQLLNSPEGQKCIQLLVKYLRSGHYENAAHQLESIKNALELLKDRLDMNTDNPELNKQVFC